MRPVNRVLEALLLLTDFLTSFVCVLELITAGTIVDFAFRAEHRGVLFVSKAHVGTCGTGPASKRK